MKALILAAAVAVAAPAEVVVVRDFAAVGNCRAIGEVRGAGRPWGMMVNAAYDRALAQLKREAAKRGGTHVQIIDSSSGFAGARMIGTAFACPKP